MKKSTKVILTMLVGFSGFMLLFNDYIGSINKNTPLETNTSTNEIETTTTSTTTTTTTKTTKKAVKTTKKASKKKTTKKKTTKVKTASISEYQNYAKSVGNYNDKQMSCLINLWNKESGWNPNSVNKSSGACGIPQALPCNKIKKQQGSNSWKAQIRWGINYITYRYKTPCGAWKHFKNKGWY